MFNHWCITSEIEIFRGTRAFSSTKLASICLRLKNYWRKSLFVRNIRFAGRDVCATREIDKREVRTFPRISWNGRFWNTAFLENITIRTYTCENRSWHARTVDTACYLFCEIDFEQHVLPSRSRDRSCIRVIIWILIRDRMLNSRRLNNTVQWKSITVCLTVFVKPFQKTRRSVPRGATAVLSLM